MCSDYILFKSNYFISNVKLVPLILLVLIFLSSGVPITIQPL